MCTNDPTLAYYNSHAEDFIRCTKEVEFTPIQETFLSYLKPNATILDLGCGSGRDSKAFIEKGFRVTAVDGSEELCKTASEYIHQNVICSTFQDYQPSETFDGIWACASLLHLPLDDIRLVIKKLTDSLAKGGCFYVSFKFGDFSGTRNGRFFTDLTDKSLVELISSIPALMIDKTYITSDVRPGRSNEKWLNAFLIKH